MLINGGSRNYIHEHEFFEKVKNYLNEKVFTQKDFLFERHQDISPCALNACDDFQTMKHQTKKQILVDIPIIRENPLYSLSF